MIFSGNEKRQMMEYEDKDEERIKVENREYKKKEDKE